MTVDLDRPTENRGVAGETSLRVDGGQLSRRMAELSAPPGKAKLFRTLAKKNQIELVAGRVSALRECFY